MTFLFRESSAAAAEVVAAGRAAGRQVTAEQVDVRDPQGCAAAVERVAERGGCIDVLVNNAGLVRDNLLGLLDDDDVRAGLDTNIGGIFNVTRAVAPHMIARGAGEEVKSRILLRRFGTPIDVAYAIWFLASRYADYITGEVLHVDGGFKME